MRSRTSAERYIFGCLLATFSLVASAEPIAPISNVDPQVSEAVATLDADGSQATATQELNLPGKDSDEYTSPPSLDAVQIYTQAELISWINKNQHLTRVKEDECQLVEDIEARASKVELPSYQFLYGDMLAWGVCVERDAPRGISYMQRAAQQGFPAALEQLGRYYTNGTLVQKDVKRALPYLRESASMGFLKAQLLLVELFVEGEGSPVDYEDAYRWLHHAIIADKQQHQLASDLLAQLSDKMPPNVVERAKASQHPY
ncbi:sel1 repeat family protein [Alginatibacterium sediminis]|uniref:Sel1 repeat family protein n=1 Tax=Alginatibacterium sediminis TaxID=2164068 RepID=A0A420E8Z6_9ALTE|nr:tetratricopeptide repeat protein [Alginatibacterium sediminis]RKF15803.1 sel1 repeat family protein [Alginatibacterium sediminis]